MTVDPPCFFPSFTPKGLGVRVSYRPRLFRIDFSNVHPMFIQADGTLNLSQAPILIPNTVHFCSPLNVCTMRRRREIGIGGTLTGSALPHHRAYGSVHGGSVVECHLNRCVGVLGHQSIGSVERCPAPVICLCASSP